MPVELTTVYFDSASVTLDHFKEALTTVAGRNARDQLLLSYDAEVAQSRPGTLQR
jgi:hypothetical protein